EPGQEGELHIPLAVELHVHAALAVHSPHGLHVHKLGDGDGGDAQVRGEGVALLLHRVDTHGGPVVASLPPLGGDVAVVVRGGAVGVPLHGPGEQVPVLVHHLGEQAGGVVEHIAELWAGEHHLVGAGLYGDGALGGGIQEEGLLGEDDFVKAQSVAGLKEGAVLLGGVEEGHRGDAALGQLGQGDFRLAVGGDGGHLQLAAEQRLAVLHHLVGEGQVVHGVGEVQIVVELKGAAGKQGGAHRADDVLKLQQAG